MLCSCPLACPICPPQDWTPFLSYIAALYAEEDAIGLSRGYKAEASVRREAELATV